MKKLSRLFLIIGAISFLLLIPTVFARQQQISMDDPIYLEYISNADCVTCEREDAVLVEFQALNPTFNITSQFLHVSTNITEFTEFRSYVEGLGFEGMMPPVVLFFKADYVFALIDEDITLDNLESRYQAFLELEGAHPNWAGDPVTPWLAFVSGFVTGLSPCVILVTAVISSTLLIQDGEKKKLLPIFTGFILGVLLMYLLLGIALVTVFNLFTSAFFGTTLRIIFAIIMFALGLWYIIDATNEKSKLFATPTWIKDFVKSMAARGTFLYTFVLGFVFSFLKIPCVGGILASLVSGVASDPSLYIPNLAMFYAGLLLPIIVLMGVLAFGVQTKKVNEIRVKYRPLLRIISGLLIIGLTIYSLWL
jgi:cytochrome c biogenesis protein CcdA